MEQDSIKLQVQDWLCRKIARVGVREVIGMPVAIGSDIGNVRQENQDKAVVLRAQVSANKFFIVGVLCDGMGGMSNGQDCASLAVASFISSCIRNRNRSVKERLHQGAVSANIDVYQKYKGDGGATLSAFILDSDGNFEAINVGDSRIYAVRMGSLDQFSVDDTIAGQLNHQLSPSHLSNKLLQFIGIGEDLEPHLIDMPAVNELEKVLLTSDGVHYLDHGTLRSISVQNVPPIELSKRLLHVAKWCGGHDNSTVIALSDFNSFFNSSDNVKTGTVQLWDAFGDVQFIGIEKNQQNDPKEQTPKNNPNKTEHHTDEVNSICPDAENTSSAEIKTIRKNKRRKKTDDQDIQKPRKPQLRIDFDD